MTDLPDSEQSTHVARPPFAASERLAAHLQQLSVDLVDLIVASLYAVAGTARRIHDDVDAEHPTTVDILHAIIERLEQLAWMIDAQNRVANARLPRPILR